MGAAKHRSGGKVDDGLWEIWHAGTPIRDRLPGNLGHVGDLIDTDEFVFLSHPAPVNIVNKDCLHRSQ
jgi:hypothetical protein